MPISWNIPLVLLSVLIAIIGSFTALGHAQRMRKASGRTAKLWAGTGSIVLGMTIWGMHFIGMLAFHLPVPLAYDLTLTLLSILPAIAASLLGFWVQCCATKISYRRIVASGILMGLGISAMHYTGMAALKMTPPIGYEPPIVALSIFIAIAASWGALLLIYLDDRINLPPLLRLLLGAVVMGLAVSGMHYTAMFGTHFQPGSLCAADAMRIKPDDLAVLIALGLMLAFGGSFFLIRGDKKLVRQDASILAGLVLVFFLTLTWHMWDNARQDALQIQQGEFEARAHESTENINVRMKTYGQIMRGLDGLFSHSDIPVSRSEFHDHIAKLRLQEDYPGIQGIRFMPLVPNAAKDRHIAAKRKEGLTAYNIWPEGRREAYAPAAYIEPFDARNQQVFGYDMLSDLKFPRTGEPVPGQRFFALESARDSGKIALSGKITLLFDAYEKKQSSTVMFLPVYKRDAPVDTVDNRRANLIGWVASVFRMSDLMEGILGKHDMKFRIDLYDGDKVLKESLLYSSHDKGWDENKKARFRHNNTLEIAGRQWSMQMISLPAFEEQIDYGRSRIIAGGGITFSLLFALLAWFLASSRTQALQVTEALRESEERWSFALEGAGEGVWDWNMLTGEMLISKRYEEILGYGEHELEHSIEAWARDVHQDDLPRVQARLGRHLEGELPDYTVELRMRCKDGGWKWILCRGMVVKRGMQGKPVRMIGTHSDITERILAQERLLKLSKAVENSPASVVITDLNGTIEYVNPRFTEVTGYTAQEAIGQNPRILKSGDLSRKFYEKLWQTITTGEVWQGEFHNKKKNGESYFEAASISPIRDERGNVAYFVAVKEDITERKRNEQAMKQLLQVYKDSEQRFRIMFQYIPISYQSLDIEGRFLDVNDEFYNLLGYTREEILNKSFDELWSEQVKPLFPATFSQFKNNQQVNEEVELVRKDGGLVTVVVNGRIQRDEQGNFVRTHCLLCL